MVLGGAAELCSALLVNMQLLPMVMDNHLVLVVLGKAGQLAGLGSLAPSDLHWGLAAGRPDILVVAAEGLVKVVQEGKMVGLLQQGSTKLVLVVLKCRTN